MIQIQNFHHKHRHTAHPDDILCYKMYSKTVIYTNPVIYFVSAFSRKQWDIKTHYSATSVCYINFYLNQIFF